MKYVAFLLLTCLSSISEGQDWRYSIVAGGSRSINQLITTPGAPTLPASIHPDAGERTGLVSQINLERSLNSHVSLRAGIDISAHRLTKTVYVTEQNNSKQLSGFGGRTLEQTVVRPYTASLGVQLNSKAFRQIILTTMLAATISGNTSNLDKNLDPSQLARRNAAITYGDVRFPSGLPNVQVLAPALSWGTTVQVGADYRLSDRTFVTLASAYHYSFQHLQNYTDYLTTTAGSVPVTYSNTGSYVNFTVGLKRTIGAIGQTERYTSYNAPFQRSHFSRQGSAELVANTWLLDIAGGYWPGKLPQNLEYTSVINAHIGYSLLPRLQAGLVVENYWIKPGNLSRIYNQWLTGGPFIRYQFTNSWLSPFIEVAYQFGQRRLVAQDSQTFTNPVSLYTVRPGVSLWLQRHLWLTIACSLRAQTERHLFGTTLAAASVQSVPAGTPTTGSYTLPTVRNPYNGPIPQVGLTYQFNRR